MLQLSRQGLFIIAPEQRYRLHAGEQQQHLPAPSCPPTPPLPASAAHSLHPEAGPDPSGSLVFARQATLCRLSRVGFVDWPTPSHTHDKAASCCPSPAPLTAADTRAPSEPVYANSQLVARASTSSAHDTLCRCLRTLARPPDTLCLAALSPSRSL
jgi:hypothetical protein